MRIFVPKINHRLRTIHMRILDKNQNLAEDLFNVNILLFYFLVYCSLFCILIFYGRFYNSLILVLSVIFILNAVFLKKSIKIKTVGFHFRDLVIQECLFNIYDAGVFETLIRIKYSTLKYYISFSIMIFFNSNTLFLLFCRLSCTSTILVDDL